MNLRLLQFARNLSRDFFAFVFKLARMNREIFVNFRVHFFDFSQKSACRIFVVGRIFFGLTNRFDNFPKMIDSFLRNF